MIKANGSKLRSMVLGGAMAGMIVLPACSEPEPQVEEVEGVIDGLEVSNARMMLAPVSGNPAAIYFDVAYNGERGISISGAEVAGAGNTEVHDTMEYNFEMTMGESGPVALTSGSEKTFEPGGLH
ncbi:MAG: copper chaperone PCu(A)C, partial [Pseudomonadota bacterium]